VEQLDICHLVGNYHMADGVIVYIPASRVLVEADQTTQNWNFNWRGDPGCPVHYNRLLPAGAH